MRTCTYAPLAAGILTLPKICKPYAEAATRTDSRSLAEKEVRSEFERSFTARKYSGSCSISEVLGLAADLEDAMLCTVVIVAELDELLLHGVDDRVEGIDRRLMGRMRFVKLDRLFGRHILGWYVSRCKLNAWSIQST
jgi:hypothetical protein